MASDHLSWALQGRCLHCGPDGCKEGRAEPCDRAPELPSCAETWHLASASPQLPVQGCFLPDSPREFTVVCRRPQWCRRTLLSAAVAPVLACLLDITNEPDIL